MNTHEPLELFHTTNLKTATALVTFGFEKVSTSIIVRATDRQESMVFWFRPRTADDLSAQVIYHDMTKGGEALAREDYEGQLLAIVPQDKHHLFYKAVTNYLRTYAANRDELINEIRNTPRQVEVEKGGVKASIREGASDAVKKAVSRFL